jgi:predicted nucleotidyltransferase
MPATSLPSFAPRCPAFGRNGPSARSRYSALGSGDDATPDSDLDVLVEFARPVALSSFLALEARLAEIAGLPVDLVSTAALKPYIGERVRAEAIGL